MDLEGHYTFNNFRFDGTITGTPVYWSQETWDAKVLAQRGRDKIAAKDFTGAVADFTAATELYHFENSTYSSRSDAKLALGDIAGAIQDCKLARDFADTDAERRFAEQKLKELHQRK